MTTGPSLESFNVQELRQLCDQRGLPAQGSKRVLVERLSPKKRQRVAESLALHGSHDVAGATELVETAGDMGGGDCAAAGIAAKSSQLVHCSRCAASPIDPEGVGIQGTSTSFVCHVCRLKALDPFNAVVEPMGLLKCALLDGSRPNFELDLPDLWQWRRQGLAVEVRMVRLDCSKAEHLWPNVFRLKVNGNVVVNVTPAKKGHKRRDVPRDISANLRRGANAVTVRLADPGQSPLALGFVLTSPRTVPELCAHVSCQGLDIAEARVRALLRTQASLDDVSCLTSVRLRLICPITMARVSCPARGWCCEHLQCFDLEAYFTSNRLTKAFNNRWRCPICTLILRPEDLCRDAFVQRVLTETREDVDEVVLAADGSWTACGKTSNSVDALLEAIGDEQETAVRTTARDVPSVVVAELADADCALVGNARLTRGVKRVGDRVARLDRAGSQPRRAHGAQAAHVPTAVAHTSAAVDSERLYAEGAPVTGDCEFVAHVAAAAEVADSRSALMDSAPATGDLESVAPSCAAARAANPDDTKATGDSQVTAPAALSTRCTHADGVQRKGNLEAMAHAVHAAEVVQSEHALVDDAELRVDMVAESERALADAAPLTGDLKAMSLARAAAEAANSKEAHADGAQVVGVLEAMAHTAIAPQAGDVACARVDHTSGPEAANEAAAIGAVVDAERAHAGSAQVAGDLEATARTVIAIARQAGDFACANVDRANGPEATNEAVLAIAVADPERAHAVGAQVAGDLEATAHTALASQAGDIVCTSVDRASGPEPTREAASVAIAVDSDRARADGAQVAGDLEAMACTAIDPQAGDVDCVNVDHTSGPEPTNEAVVAVVVADPERARVEGAQVAGDLEATARTAIAPQVDDIDCANVERANGPETANAAAVVVAVVDPDRAHVDHTQAATHAGATGGAADVDNATAQCVEATRVLEPATHTASAAKAANVVESERTHVASAQQPPGLKDAVHLRSRPAPSAPDAPSMEQALGELDAILSGRRGDTFVALTSWNAGSCEISAYRVTGGCATVVSRAIPRLFECTIAAGSCGHWDDAFEATSSLWVVAGLLRGGLAGALCLKGSAHASGGHAALSLTQQLSAACLMSLEAFEQALLSHGPVPRSLSNTISSLCRLAQATLEGDNLALVAEAFLQGDFAPRLLAAGTAGGPSKGRKHWPGQDCEAPQHFLALRARRHSIGLLSALLDGAGRQARASAERALVSGGGEPGGARLVEMLVNAPLDLELHEVLAELLCRALRRLDFEAGTNVKAQCLGELDQGAADAVWKAVSTYDSHPSCYVDLALRLSAHRYDVGLFLDCDISWGAFNIAGCAARFGVYSMVLEDPAAETVVEVPWACVQAPRAALDCCPPLCLAVDFGTLMMLGGLPPQVMTLVGGQRILKITWRSSDGASRAVRRFRRLVLGSAAEVTAVGAQGNDCSKLVASGDSDAENADGRERPAVSDPLPGTAPPQAATDSGKDVATRAHQNRTGSSSTPVAGKGPGGPACADEHEAQTTCQPVKRPRGRPRGSTSKGKAAVAAPKGRGIVAAPMGLVVAVGEALRSMTWVADAKGCTRPRELKEFFQREYASAFEGVPHGANPQGKALAAALRTWHVEFSFRGWKATVGTFAGKWALLPEAVPAVKTESPAEEKKTPAKRKRGAEAIVDGFTPEGPAREPRDVDGCSLAQRGHVGAEDPASAPPEVRCGTLEAFPAEELTREFGGRAAAVPGGVEASEA